MKKILILTMLSLALSSCKSKTESCVQRLIDEKGYTYDEACTECDEMRLDSQVRNERE